MKNEEFEKNENFFKKFKFPVCKFVWLWINWGQNKIQRSNFIPESSFEFFHFNLEKDSKEKLSQVFLNEKFKFEQQQ